MDAHLRIELLHGEAIATRLDALAALRITVFREWPYLYEGTLDYERQYLQHYVECPQSLVALAYDGEQLVGATTALPLLQAAAELREPFEATRLPLTGTLYFGESVVLKSHRGLGLGLRFFELREAHARSLGMSECCFCAVDRPAQHPLKPADYVGNDRFWQRRGYTRRPELVASFAWLDLGERAPSFKPMTYWTKLL